MLWSKIGVIIFQSFLVYHNMFIAVAVNAVEVNTRDDDW